MGGRLLRDHLRSHPDDRDRYASLKQRLRDLDGDAYTRAKTALIQELVDLARSERGLPTVPVWAVTDAPDPLVFPRPK